MDLFLAHLVRSCVIVSLALGLDLSGVLGRASPFPDLVCEVHSVPIQFVLPHPTDCDKYIRCIDGQPISQSCPVGLFYNPVTTQCDFSSSFRCLQQQQQKQQWSRNYNDQRSQSKGIFQMRIQENSLKTLPTNPDVTNNKNHQLNSKQSTLHWYDVPNDTQSPRAEKSLTTVQTTSQRNYYKVPSGLRVDPRYWTLQAPKVSPSPITIKPVTTTATTTTTTMDPTRKKLICYYTNWAQYRNGPAKFLPEDIDPTLCTHIHYAFAKLNSSSELAPYEWNDESEPWRVGMYERVLANKKKNPELRILLSVGGWNMGSNDFTAMVENPNKRENFIRTGIQFLRKWKFDGLDIDWEYPGGRGSPPVDKRRFTDLVRETMEAFEDESEKTGKERLLLSAAVGAGKDTIDDAYEVAEISQILDYVCLMSYDFFGAWDNVTGHVSPLYPPHNATTEKDKTFNVHFASNYWVKLGCPRHKLVIGLITYARSFTLADPNVTGLKAPVNGPGQAGQYTREAGDLAYYEVNELLQKGARVEWLEDQKVPYLVLDRQWVGFENQTSLRIKVDFIREQGFAGAMVWDLDNDDFGDHFCGQGKYPLISDIHKRLMD